MNDKTVAALEEYVRQLSMKLVKKNMDISNKTLTEQIVGVEKDTMSGLLSTPLSSTVFAWVLLGCSLKLSYDIWSTDMRVGLFLAVVSLMMMGYRYLHLGAVHSTVIAERAYYIECMRGRVTRILISMDLANKQEIPDSVEYTKKLTARVTETILTARTFGEENESRINER